MAGSRSPNRHSGGRFRAEIALRRRLRRRPIRGKVLIFQRVARISSTGSLGRMTRGVFDKAEALVFRDHLVEAGVPEGAVTTEPRATNTLENVRLGMAALEARGVPVGSALLVAKGFLMRRCIATFAQQFSGVRVQACPPRGGNTTPCWRAGSSCS